MMADFHTINEALRKLYREIEAEGGYAAPQDHHGNGKNEGIDLALKHLEAAGFSYNTSPFDQEGQSA